MQQMLPLLLGWLSETPDPDLGLLDLRNLLDEPQPVAELGPDVPGVAGGGPAAVPPGRHEPAGGRDLQRNPDLVARLPDPDRLRTRAAGDAGRDGDHRPRVARRARRAAAGACGAGRIETCSA